MRSITSYDQLEAFGRVRPSRSFFMRDFLHSEIAAWHGIRNVPEDPDTAIEAGQHLCEALLEPLQRTFGRIHIRSGYRSPTVNAFGNVNGQSCAANEANYASHIWDRRDAEGRLGATACIVVPWLVDRIERGGSWTGMAWWIHDHLPYSRLRFFPKLCAFNMQWREQPVRRIDSYVDPKGCLTKPAWRTARACMRRSTLAFRGSAHPYERSGSAERMALTKREAADIVSSVPPGGDGLMQMDRRAALGTLATGVAATGLRIPQAEALDAASTASILLYNRTTGAYRVFTPNSLFDPGTSRGGTDAGRFAKRNRSTRRRAEFRRNVLDSDPSRRPDTARLNDRHAGMGGRAWNGTGWVRKAGGSLTFNGARWTPRGQLFDLGGFVVQLDTTQIASGSLALTSTADTSWTWRTRVVRNEVQPFDSSFAIGCEAGRLYGMARSATLSQFTAIEAGPETALNIVHLRSLPSQRGQVSTFPGRVMVYDRLTGLAQFYALGSNGSLSGATLMLTAQLAVGWTHVVPFRYGWFFYHRTRRLAQMGIVRSRFPSPGWRLVNGYLWPDNTLGDFTDAVGFG